MPRSTSPSNEEEVLNMIRRLLNEQPRGRRIESSRHDRRRRYPSTTTQTSDTYASWSEEGSLPSRGYDPARTRRAIRQDAPPSTFQYGPPPPYSRPTSTLANESATHITYDGPADHEHTLTLHTRTADMDQTVVVSNNARRSGRGRDEMHHVASPGPPQQRRPPPSVPSAPAVEAGGKAHGGKSKDPAKKQKYIRRLGWALT